MVVISAGGGASGSGAGVRGKRRVVEEEPMDKATQQKQRRMIKNNESAARSRKRKQTGLVNNGILGKIQTRIPVSMPIQEREARWIGNGAQSPAVVAPPLLRMKPSIVENDSGDSLLKPSISLKIHILCAITSEGHQTNLAKRAAREAKEAPLLPQPNKRKTSALKKNVTVLERFF